MPNTAMITDSHRTAERTWRTAHADRAQQPDLAGALVDRQRECVRDTDQRDEHRQEQQRVDEVHDRVDGGFLRLLVLGVVAQVGGRVRLDDLLDRGPTVGRTHAGRERGEHEEVEALRREEVRVERLE